MEGLQAHYDILNDTENIQSVWSKVLNNVNILENKTKASYSE